MRTTLLELLALAEAFKSMVDFVCFCAEFDVSTWVFASGIKPAERKVDWIAIATVQIITITCVAVCHADHVAVMLQPNH